MKEGSRIGLESLGKFLKASFTCWPFIFIFGLLSMILGYREAKEKKYVLIWVIPVSLIFAVPIYNIMVALRDLYGSKQYINKMNA